MRVGERDPFFGGHKEKQGAYGFVCEGDRRQAADGGRSGFYGSVFGGAGGGIHLVKPYCPGGYGRDHFVSRGVGGF